jgi:hypothetical protein
MPNPTPHTAGFYRKHFDSVVWLREMESGLQAKASASEVELTCLESTVPKLLWTDEAGLSAVLDDILNAMIASAVRGSRFQITAKHDEPLGEWFLFSIRDCSNGRDENWELSRELETRVKFLEGFVDVKVEAGRTTTCTLHIPVGTLSGWLRRNLDASHVIAVDCVEGRWRADRESVLQRLSQARASIHRLNDATYLVAFKTEEDAESLRSTISDQLSDARVRLLGSMRAFVSQLDLATRVDAAHHNVVADEKVVGLTTNVDLQSSDKETFLRPYHKISNSMQTPLRPRRRIASL